jgi:hypothetical protein
MQTKCRAVDVLQAVTSEHKGLKTVTGPIIPCIGLLLYHKFINRFFIYFIRKETVRKS